MLSKVENTKNLFRIPESTGARELEFEPYVLLEARIDFNDVRTGFSGQYRINKTVTIPEDLVEPLWDDNTIPDMYLEELEENPPERAGFRTLPGYVDAKFISWMETRFIQYLLDTFAVSIYRNHYLGTYSSSGEKLADFIIRCIELIQAPMYSEFDSMLEVFKRKLEQLQQKYLNEKHSEDIDKIKKVYRNRELFNHISERIAALFLRTEFHIQRLTPPMGPVSHVHELEERLTALHFEAQESVAKILDFHEEKAKSVDEYILHPTIKNIHFIRSFILWMPTRAVVDDR